jgi:hypothetical protein
MRLLLVVPQVNVASFQFKLNEKNSISTYLTSSARMKSIRQTTHSLIGIIAY